MSPPDAAFCVLSRMRDASLYNINFFSDRQPKMIRVESRAGGRPSIWLHDDDAGKAWIIVNIYPRAWCQLAYQFGHELGHVLCNSWDKMARPMAPCQWLEESLVEAFTIRGLGFLAKNWERDPPFDGDASFAASNRLYRDNLITQYKLRQRTRHAPRGFKRRARRSKSKAAKARHRAQWLSAFWQTLKDVVHPSTI